MFTQCPKCESVFMVSDKDTKAHEGLVRCGNCYSVFNSSWNLTEDPRDDFIEAPESKGKPELPASQGSGFTFSIMGNAAASRAEESENLQAADAKNEEPASLEQTPESATEMTDEGAPEIDLEPFPDPDMGDLPLPPSPEPEVSKPQDSLLYFDSNEVDDEPELAENTAAGAAQIDDLTILQTPSISSEIAAPADEERVPEPGLNDEPAMGSLSEESMWPGSDDDFELPAADGGEEKVNTPDIVLPPISTRPTQSQAVEVPVDDGELLRAKKDVGMNDDPMSDAVPEKGEDLLQGDETSWMTAYAQGEEKSKSVPELDRGDQLLPLPPEHFEKASKNTAADDTFKVAGEVAETDEFFSLDALPKTADEAFAPSEEAKAIDDSVFITSEDEEIDDAYVPISLKDGQEDELFHGLDEFPEPGELSELNYEDTMEINAMLEEANISKAQIESALSASKIDDEDDDDFTEKVLSSSGAESDLTEALFPEDGESASDKSSATGQVIVGANTVFSRFMGLLFPGLRKKKALKVPEVADDQTQLIRSLNRGSNTSELPVWVGKYSLPVLLGTLFLILLGQIGYFYMDNLVRITPLRPLLEVGCKVAGCTVPNIQNIEDIEQLSSRLAPLSGSDGGFKVSSILVNRGIRKQSFPALELTLTDRSGNMISRRVVMQDEYLAKERPFVMMPNEAVDIEIRFRTPSIRVDGFELRPVSQNWQERSKGT